MIKRFWGKNLGKLKTFDVELGPLTLLVGPNASGKSTFLRGLRLLVMLNRMPLHGPRGTLRLGFRATIEDQFPNIDPDEELNLGINCDNSTGSGTYEIVLKYVRGRLMVIREKAYWNPISGVAFSFDSEKDHIATDYRGSQISSDTPRGGSLGHLFYFEARYKPDLFNKLAPLYELINCFSPFHVYRFSPSAIAKPVEVGSNVSHDGMGLPAELDRLLGEKREVYDELEKNLISIFPHLKKMNISTIKGETGLKGLFFETKSGVRIPAELESDGVLLTLAYLWLSTSRDTSLGVEEPETATYPKLLESRWDLLKKVSHGFDTTPPLQIIATTHSSALLTLAQQPSLIRIFDVQEDGTSKIYTPPEEFMNDVIYRRLGWSIGG